MGFFRAGAALILWAAGCASGSAQTHTYSVHVDQDNNPATGCTITTPAGTISGIEAVLSAHVAVEPPRVTGQELARCQAGVMQAPTPIAGAYAVGFDQGPESFDVIELGAPLAAFGAGAGQSGDWRLVFTSRGALLDGADMTDAVLVQGLGGSAAPTLIPAASLGALALLALALAIVVVRLGRRHPQLFSVLLVVGALGLSGLVWAAVHVLDGQIGEWPASPLLTDPAGDASADEPPIDIRQVFAAASAGQAHFRIDVSETRLSQLLPAHLESQWSLAENSANGTVLGPVVTDTAGLGAVLQLVLDSQLPATAFAFDPSSSQLTVANPGELDFETQPQFELEFSVTVAALPGFSLPWPVRVELSDVNEAPTLAAQSFSVRETAADGSAVGEVVASDPDAGVNGELTFAIIGGSGAAIFAIDAVSGQISVADASAITPAQSPFSLEVRVSDGGSPALDATASMSITVVDVNDPPTFTPGADVEVVEDSAAFDAPWAGAIDDGDGGGQGLEFVLVNSNPALFSTAPAIDAGTGNLTFTPAADANGSAQITVVLRDDGGTDLGGQDSSSPHLLNISVRPVNDAPGFAASNPPPVLQDSGAAEVAGWAVFDPGAANESTQQALEYQVSDIDNPALFSVPPTVEAATGTLRYTPATGARGSSGFTVRVRDDGGTADGGEDLSGPQTFTISVEAINNPPSFEPGQNVTVLEDAGAQAVSGWATAIDDGDGGTQALAFVIQGNSNPALFAVAPAVDAATGTLSFTPAPDANGSAQITLALRDDGGTADGGSDTSEAAVFPINITPVNDAPDFTIPAAAPSVLENGGAQSVAGFATAISAGPSDEAAQTLAFTLDVTATSGSLAFATAPQIDAGTGMLSYSPQADTSGSATVAVRLVDDGGTADGGIDTSVVRTFTIEVLGVNSPPTFTVGGPVAVDEDSGPYTGPLASNIDDGDLDEVQALEFIVLNNSNPALFASGPHVDADSGQLTFEPATDAFGTASITLILRDDGGTENGGADTSAEATFEISIQGINDPPGFDLPAAAPAVLEDAGAQVVAGFASNLVTGPANESDQTLTGFTVSLDSSDATLAFSAAPAIDVATGTLTYTVAPGAYGSASLSATLHDDGGNANGGIASFSRSFSIQVTGINDAPGFTPGGPVSVLEDSGPQDLPWASGIHDGDDGTQSLSFIVSHDNPALFAVAPAIDAVSGNLSFTPAADAFGTATVTVRLQDDGGTANAGTDTSEPVDFMLSVAAVNDPPVVVAPTNVPVHRHIGIRIPASHEHNLLAHVTDVDGPDAAPFELSPQTSQPSAQGGRYSVFADGSWHYDPPATGSVTLHNDSFDIEVCDQGVPLPRQCTVATVSLALSGPHIWFVDASAPVGGDGTLARPFQSVAAAMGVAWANDSIFVASGNYSGGFTLLEGQRLIGQGATAASFDALFGITVPTESLPRPTVGGTRPLLTTEGVATPGIVLATDNTLRGIEIGNTTGAALYGNGFGTLTLAENRISGSGQALALSAGTLAQISGLDAFDQISSSSGPNNIVLSNVGGIAHLGGGSLEGAAGTAWRISGGSVTLDYAGSVTAGSGQRPLDIENATGGVVVLRGPVSSTDQGVRLTNNTGATVRLAGGLSLSTGAAPAFVATGGGTIEICDEYPCDPDATGSLLNTLSTTTATALQVSDTRIGPANLELRSITSSGGSSVGIALSNTGSEGGLVVKGNGSPGSGGSISNKSGSDASELTAGSGIVLQDTAGVSLRWMHLSGFSNSGIIGRNVTDFVLQDSVLDGVIGDNAAAVEAPIVFGLPGPVFANGLQGNSLIRNVRISGGVEHNLEIYNQSGTMALLIDGTLAVSEGDDSLDPADDVAGCSVDGAAVDGIQIEIRGTAASTIDIERCLFRDNASQAVQASVLEDAVASVRISESFARRLTAGNEGFVIQNGGNARLATQITGNTLNNFGGTSIFVGQVPGNANALPGDAVGLIARIDGNTVSAPATATNHAIIAYLTSTISQVSRAHVVIEGNTVLMEGATRPILVDTPDANTTPMFSATVRNNDITVFDPGVGVTSDISARRGTGCLNIRDNAAIGPGIRVRQVAPGAVQLERGASGSDSAAQVLQDNHPSGTATEVDGSVTVVPNGTCPAPPA